MQPQDGLTVLYPYIRLILFPKVYIYTTSMGLDNIPKEASYNQIVFI